LFEVEASVRKGRTNRRIRDPDSVRRMNRPFFEERDIVLIEIFEY
jgi:hypothetical protein